MGYLPILIYSDPEKIVDIMIICLVLKVIEQFLIENQFFEDGSPNI